MNTSIEFTVNQSQRETNVYKRHLFSLKNINTH